MSWQIALQTLETEGKVEYGIFQRESKPGTPRWRRHGRGKRFESVKNALFSKQGALKALNGTARYSKQQYSAGTELYVAYAAAWLQRSSFAFLARQATPEPEVTIVPVSRINEIELDDASALTNHLAVIFGESADEYGIRFLSACGQISER